MKSLAPNLYRLTRHACTTLLALTLSGTALANQDGDIGTAPLASGPARTGSYRFDFGPASQVADGAVGIQASYAGQDDWGWLDDSPRTDFDREELARSRNALTRDSVRANVLRFGVSAPAGDWHVIFWAESGHEDVSSLRFFINGEQQALAWREFDAPSEPRENMRNEYRLFIGHAAAGEKGLVFEWQGGGEPVHLIGLSLIPSVPGNVALAGNISRLLAEAKDFEKRPPLGPLLEALSEQCRRDEDPDCEFIQLQVETLSLAEDWYEGLRGWEWARRETGLSMFSRYAQSIALLDALLGDPAFADSPLHDRALYNRARLQYWVAKEQHGPRTIQATERDLHALVERGLDTPLLRMYRGERVDTPDACDSLEGPADAPAWAVRQREVLCRMRLVAYWWIDERQADNGELGGKLADDVEMTRWWAVPVLAGDRHVADGWLKLADGVWSSDLMEDGYFRAPIDVEHSSEPISDTALILALADAEAAERLLPSVRHFKGHWTVLTPDGRRYFRSAWIGSSAVDERPPRNRDVPMNARAVKAVRYAAFLDPAPGVAGPLAEWSRFWADAAMDTSKGKPAGIVPPSVRGADRAINGDEPTWHRANMYWHYYEWQAGAGARIYDQLLFTYRLGGDAALLRPLTASLEFVRANRGCKTARENDDCWAAQTLMAEREFLATLEQWRLLVADGSRDDLLLPHAGDYLRYRLSGDAGVLDSVAEDVLEHMRYNFPLLTSEALFTDRVYATEADGTSGLRDMLGMLTGSLTTSSPYFDFTWEDAPPSFTALVAGAASVQVYHFGPGDGIVTARLWGLPTGKYLLRALAGDKVLQERTVTVDQPGTRVELYLTARQLLTFEFQSR